MERKKWRNYRKEERSKLGRENEEWEGKFRDGRECEGRARQREEVEVKEGKI